ncbi:hypothetical protein AB0J37_10600 [Microbispora rosea]|uniref:hypothetical protein n=1 Tax=Microbispora rosea TaxID=58117 RepID=UPI0034492072
MVYHTADAPGGGNFRRSVAVDKLYFNADGTVQKVIQTGGGGTGGDNKALTATAGHDPRLNVSPAQAPPAAVTPAAPGASGIEVHSTPAGR